MPQPLRVLVADDHDAVRRSLCAMVKAQAEVCGVATNGREAVEQARTARPDLVLLDLKMPGMNGLEAAREILLERPGTRVLLLTVHPSDELAVEARDIGIEAVVLKSDADTLGTLLARMQPQAAHLAGAEIGNLRHIAAFFASDAERDRLIDPCIAEGLSNGEKVFVVANLSGNGRAARLAQAGIDAEYARRRGWLEVLSWEDLYLTGGVFDIHATMDKVRGALARAADEGFPAARFIGNMEWAAERPEREALVEYEALINDGLSPDTTNVLVCNYDVSKFDVETIAGVMRAHPVVVVEGKLFENPSYLPLVKLMAERDARHAGF